MGVVDGLEEKSSSSSSSPASAATDRVWGPVIRPKQAPNITKVKGCRSHFCFRVAGRSTIAMRELSCRCPPCLERAWEECQNKEEVGDWSLIHMEATVGRSAIGTRARLKSQREHESKRRQALARLCEVGEYVAVESENDKAGFPFWVARVTKQAWQHQGPASVTEHGVKLKRGGWYFEVGFLERYPATSTTIFQEYSARPWVIDVEGIVERRVQLTCTNARSRAVWTAGLVRKRRGAAAPLLFRASPDEVSRLSKAAGGVRLGSS